MNRINLIGRLTREPETRYTQSNVAVTKFSLAVNRNFKNQDGEYEADFINCVAFKTLGETITKYVKKGDRLGLEGRLQVRSYENDKGKNVYVSEVIVENIDFLESKKQETPTQETPTKTSYTKEEIDDIPLPDDPFTRQTTITDDDLPF